MEILPPSTVASLAPRAASSPRALATELGAWVLVGARPEEEVNEWSFRTLSARTVRDASGSVEAVLDDHYLVMPLKKARTGPFAGTILIGRSRTNDVCILHSSVSKLHARVRSGPDGVTVADAGSSNGTFLGAEQLAPDVEHPVGHAEVVRFGACSFQVFEPQRFVELLGRFHSG